MAVETAELERILNRVHEWTRSADNKVGVLAGSEAALFAYVLSKIEKWWTSPGQSAPTYLCLAAVTALMLAGIGCAVGALYPRDRDPKRRRSVTFFGDISKLSLGDYRTKLDRLDADDLRSDYVSQIHVSSRIALVKHRLIRYSAGLFVAGMTLLGLLRVAVGLGWW